MSPHVQPLESRRLFAASISLSGSVMTITGTTSADTIDVSKFGGNYAVSVDPTTRPGYFPVSKVKSIVVNLNGGNDKFTSEDLVVAPMKITGGSGNDSIKSGGGNDTVQGNDGNDTLVAGAGADNVSGGTGTDLMSYANYTSAVTVKLDNAAGDGKSGENDNVLDDVENVTGGSGNDTLAGNKKANVLRGGGGSDAIVGDYAYKSYKATDGGPVGLKPDSIYGDAGNDTLTATADDTIVYGGSGDDVMPATQTDVIWTGTFYGEDGKDFITAYADLIDGGAGNDDLEPPSAGTIKGGSGDDYIKATIDAGVMDGGSGKDVFYVFSKTTAVKAADGEADKIYLITSKPSDKFNVTSDKFDTIWKGASD